LHSLKIAAFSRRTVFWPYAVSTKPLPGRSPSSFSNPRLM
jgi:hypothetical protein